MKWFFSIIVVLNLMVFAYGQLKPNRQDVEAQPDLNASQIKLLPPGWVAASDAANEPLQTAEASQPGEETPPALCFQWGKLNDKLLTRVKGGLPSLRLTSAQLSEDTAEEKPRKQYVVYYPALATDADTNQMALDLATAGFPSNVMTGQGRGNLSLGIFSEENNAKRLERRVRAAGFDRVKLDERNDDSEKNSATQLTFNRLTDEQAQKLKALQQRLTPGIRVKEVPCDKPATQP